MFKSMILTAICFALLTGIALPQEVIIKDFPLGVGGSVNRDIFKPYLSDLKAISDTLSKYPLLRAIVTGGADGHTYRENNDAVNPGLALGRAHILREFLITRFNVDSTQIIIQSEDNNGKGGPYRFAGIRIDSNLHDLEARLEKVENRPPVEKHFTEVKEISGNAEENLRLQFGLGVSSSPFGGIPIAAATIGWKQIIFAEGVVGHTFWNSDFDFRGTELDTKRRLVGGHIIFYPVDDLPVGIVGGWVRMEEISQDYYEYVRLSEGPTLGLRATPFKFLSITGAYNPSNRRFAGDNRSKANNDQFLLSVTTHLTLGGQK